MSAFKGTPGPWKVGTEYEDGGEIEVVSEDRPYICLVLSGAIDEHTRANARLIAAAPELLEVLEHVRDAMEASGWWDGDEHVFELVVAAIDKATGEQA